MDLPIETVFAVLAIYCGAGVIKGAVGFGLPVTAAALLPFVVPIEMALGLNAIVIIYTNLLQVRLGRAYRDGLLAAWPIMAGMVVAVPVGAYFAAGLDGRNLLLVLGIFVFAFSAISFFSPALSVPPAWRIRGGLVTGLVSGTVGGLVSAPGPTYVPFMVALQLPRAHYITGLAYVMVMFGAMSAVSYAWVGLLRAEHILPSIAAIPAAVLGMFIGDRLARMLPVEIFRRVVLVLLACVAILLIRRALS